MDKDTLIALLKKRVPRNIPPETMARLEAALTVPRSFDELEWELPPAARYLGPGVWLDTIRNARQDL
jgi:hypothetical protein